MNYERSYRARGTIFPVFVSVFYYLLIGHVLYGGLNIFFSMQKSEYASVYNAFLNTNKKSYTCI